MIYDMLRDMDISDDLIKEIRRADDKSKAPHSGTEPLEYDSLLNGIDFIMDYDWDEPKVRVSPSGHAVFIWESDVGFIDMEFLTDAKIEYWFYIPLEGTIRGRGSPELVNKIYEMLENMILD